MQALQEDNDALNREIIILGKRTEEKEREVENICINLLLKQQPVASDLRQISAALKNDYGFEPYRRTGGQYC